MKKMCTLLLLCGLFSNVRLKAQTTYFSQDFNPLQLTPIM